MLDWFLYETVFDYANKVAQVEKLDNFMASPTFWDNSEKAQETVLQLKCLRSVVEPLRGAIQSCDDLTELTSMLDEDPAVAIEVQAEVTKLELAIEQLELKVLLNGPLDECGAILSVHAREGGLDAEGLTDLLYRQSGLLGVSGLSGDLRDLLGSREPEAREAVDLYVHRAARETAALATSLGGLDGLVFTGGVGENLPQIRALICARLSWLGVRLDAAANAGGAGRLSAADSAVAIWVIPTDEEVVIARQTAALLDRRE